LQNDKNHFTEAKTYKNIRISDATSNSVLTSAWLRGASNMKRDKRHFCFCNLSKYKTKRKMCGRHSILCPHRLKSGGTRPLCPLPNCAHVSIMYQMHTSVHWGGQTT